MSHDARSNDIEASLPCLLVPAATELSGKNVSESGTENGEVLVWDVSGFVLFAQMVELSLEGVWLVEQVDGGIQTRDNSFTVGPEQSRAAVTIADLGKQGFCLWCLGEERSPKGNNKVFTIGSRAVSTAPLSLDLQPGQSIATGSACASNQRSQNQNNGGLHCR